MADIWDSFLVYYQSFQNLFIVIAISAIIIVLFMKFELKNPLLIILAISFVFIYLYAMEQFSNKIFSIFLLIALITIYFVWKGRFTDGNSKKTL